MTEMARVPTNLDNLMNEGIAFLIERFKRQLQNCPVGQYPVMIGQRKRTYNTLDKVIQRLDLIHNVMAAMHFITIDVH